MNLADPGPPGTPPPVMAGFEKGGVTIESRLAAISCYYDCGPLTLAEVPLHHFAFIGLALLDARHPKTLSRLARAVEERHHRHQSVL